MDDVSLASSLRPSALSVRAVDAAAAEDDEKREAGEETTVQRVDR